MGYKSRPGGWRNPTCFGYCKFKSSCKPECRKKDLYEDCRETCKNYGFKCEECMDAELYEE